MRELTDPDVIRALLARHGFRFSRSMGQNFLIDPEVPERIAEVSGADERTGVLEVGPGIGCLTSSLARRAGSVVAVELDAALRPMLAETLEGLSNVQLVFADALKLDLRALAAERLGGLRPIVCANLPYNVTSPLLEAFIDADCFESITVMVQREVAHRLCASPATSDYGSFTIFVGWHYAPEKLFDVSPDCFMPQPKVTSSVVRLTRRAEPPAETKDPAFMFRVVRAAFCQRRKTLLNALSNGLKGFSKQTLSEAIAAAGIEPAARGETLSIAQFAALSDIIAETR